MHFSWVKGHAEIDGNELVDQSEKEAAVKDGPAVYDEIPTQAIIIREKENRFHM
jgi:ribonuclease HI